MKWVRVRVSQSCINQAVPGACPISIAIQETLHEKDVLVDYNGAFVSGVPYYLPKRCDSFMSRFDKGESVRPFTFEMLREP